LQNSTITKLRRDYLSVILHFFQERQEILEAYLFGSHANFHINKLSDIDIAIYIDKSLINENEYPYGYKSYIISRLVSLLSFNKIDLVVLNEANILLKHRVISKGKRIFSRNSLESQRREYQSIQSYLDFKPFLAKMDKILYKRIDSGEYGT